MLISIYQSVCPCVSCVIVFVCDFKPEYQPKPYHPRQSLSKFDIFLHKLHKARSHIQPKKQGNKKSRVGRLDEVWKGRVGGIFAKKIGLDTFCRQWFWLKVQVSVLLLDRFYFVLCLGKISRIFKNFNEIVVLSSADYNPDFHTSAWVFCKVAAYF